MTFFGLKHCQDLENPPTKNSKEYPPPPRMMFLYYTNFAIENNRLNIA